MVNSAPAIRFNGTLGDMVGRGDWIRTTGLLAPNCATRNSSAFTPGSPLFRTNVIGSNRVRAESR